jgi:guanylate kinase
MSDFPGKFGFSVSHTTRQPRVGEVNGVHYHFTSPEKMLSEIGRGSFLEHALVHGNHYGTSFKAIEAVKDNGLICILDIDVQGVEAVKKSNRIDSDDVVFVMLVPPSIDELERRLRRRGTDCDEVIARRVRRAADELKWRDRDNYWDSILVNDDIDICYAELVSLVGRYFGLKPNSGVGHFTVRSK